MAKHAAHYFDFDLELWLWQGLRHAWTWLRRDPAELRREEAGILLEPHRERLQLMARALSGLPLLVRPTRELPGTDGRHLLLPERCCFYPSPEANLLTLRLLTVALAEAAATGRWATAAALPAADELEWARSVLLGYPGLAEGLRCYEAAELTAGRAHPWAPAPAEVPGLSFRRMTQWAGLSAPTLKAGERVAEAAEVTSEAEAPVQEEVTRVHLDQADQQDYPLMHTFSKIETLDEYKGLARETDGADDLQDQLEAMQELKMNQVVRVDDAVHSVYRADLRLNDQGGEVRAAATGGIPYDEWDARRRQYKRDWCRVQVQPYTERRPDWYHEQVRTHGATIRQLKQMLEKTLSAMQRVKRQKEGPELDLDALVEHRVRLHTGATPLEELYLQLHRRQRDLAVVILLDVSLSTDAYVENRRVLDVCKESLVVLSHVFDHFQDAMEVAGFCSHTRNQVLYRPLKAFHEDWGPARDRLGAINPQGYTRIGPALRHATRRVLEQPAGKRVILLLSDGKPNDYDRYEGRHGIGDIRQAIREAMSRQVHVHALAVDKQARDYLPHMLGPSQYSILRHPQDLPLNLHRFMLQVARS